jgi:hypothetical protein
VAGADVSAGFVHSCLAKASEMVTDVVKLIKTLISAAYVAGFDETTLRSGVRRAEEVRAGGSHRAVLIVLPRRAHDGLLS